MSEKIPYPGLTGNRPAPTHAHTGTQMPTGPPTLSEMSTVVDVLECLFRQHLSWKGPAIVPVGQGGCVCLFPPASANWPKRSLALGFHKHRRSRGSWWQKPTWDILEFGGIHKTQGRKDRRAFCRIRTDTRSLLQLRRLVALLSFALWGSEGLSPPISSFLSGWNTCIQITWSTYWNSEPWIPGEWEPRKPHF